MGGYPSDLESESGTSESESSAASSSSDEWRDMGPNCDRWVVVKGRRVNKVDNFSKNFSQCNDNHNNITTLVHPYPPIQRQHRTHPRGMSHQQVWSKRGHICTRNQPKSVCVTHFGSGQAVGECLPQAQAQHHSCWKWNHQIRKVWSNQQAMQKHRLKPLITPRRPIVETGNLSQRKERAWLLSQNHWSSERTPQSTMPEQLLHQAPFWRM